MGNLSFRPEGREGREQGPEENVCIKDRRCKNVTGDWRKLHYNELKKK
jgi:hypothetical protein